jgi:hypothetical protein
MGDDRYRKVFFIVGSDGSLMERGQEVGSGEMLRGEHAVHGLKRKLTPAVKEIGKMRLAESSLARQ